MRRYKRLFSLRRLLLGSASTVAVALMGAGPALAYTCTTGAVQGLAPSDVTIDNATPVASAQSGAQTIPAHCEVAGHLLTPGLRGEQADLVNFLLELPDADWNGKLLFSGGGGFDGGLGEFGGGAVGLSHGYATVATDTGHTGGADAAWAYKSFTRIVDFGYRAVHVVKNAADAISGAYYDTPVNRDYFMGCSTGGRQAFDAATHYPGDFDGIIAGAPAMDYSGLMTEFIWDEQTLLRGPEYYLPAGKLQLITDQVKAQCDALDGVVDGIIGDPTRCRFDPAILQCSPSVGDAPDCLTAGQVDSLRRLYAGPSTSSGLQLYTGLPVGGEATAGNWTTWVVGATPPSVQPDGTFDYSPGTAPLQVFYASNYVKYLYFPFNQQDPNRDYRGFNFDTDPPKRFSLGKTQDASADLRPYQERGGKLIAYGGWADAVVPLPRTIQYLRSVWSFVGGRASAGEFIRLYPVPGMAHCAGGGVPDVFGQIFAPLQAAQDPAHDVLAALDAWVENGTPPRSITATQYVNEDPTQAVARTRPLCVYPEVATYNGAGSIDEAANFRCQ